MSFKVENMEEKNMVKLVIETTAEEFEAGLNTAFNKNKNKISVPGFRKGKAPRKMVEKLYGAEIFYEDAANAIIPDAYAKAADESELEIVSQPKIDVVQIEAGKPFIFEATVAVKPEVELGQYKGVEVAKCDTDVTDADDQIDFSILGRIGKAIAWIFAPLGFGNWQATVASITGLVAKENIVGTMGILYSAGEGTVYANMAATFTVVSGYAFLAFNLLCAPCFAAMGAIKREMNNTKWFWIAIGYQCGYAYLVGLVINQIAGLITGDTAFNVFTVIAILIIVGFIYLLFRPYKESKTLKVDSKKLLNATK